MTEDRIQKEESSLEAQTTMFNTDVATASQIGAAMKQLLKK